MARNGVASRWRRAEKLDGWDLSPSDSEEVHVLAVDDSLVDRKVIERLLRITSCRVTAVDSGMRALQFLGLDEEKRSSVAFNGLKVDLIITDYCMPGMTGYELLKKIKESSTFKEIPVVIMSSENILARIDRCLEEGAEDFLVKPVKLSDVKRLRSCLTKEAKRRNIESGNKRKIPEPSDQSSTQSPPSDQSSTQSQPSDQSSTQSPPSVTSPVLSISSPSSPSPSSSPLSSSLSAPSSPSPISASSSPFPISIDSPIRRLKTTDTDEISPS